MQGAVNLSPAAVMVSTLIGGSLFWFAGALLVLPVAAAVKVVLDEVWWVCGRLPRGALTVPEHLEGPNLHH
jgi:hypothetical protein